MPDGTRNPNSQSPRSLRWLEARSLTYVEQGGKIIVHSAYDDADVPLEASLDTSDGDTFKVEGFDRFSLLADWTKGSAEGFAIRLQASPIHSITDSDWYDVMEARFSSELVQWERRMSSAASGRYVFEVAPVHGSFMRVVVFALGSDTTGARATVSVARVTTLL